MNVYFTSDTHFGHKNIVRGTTEWENARDKVRDFDTLEEHNQVLVDNINGMVKENDTLYHLGDWSFGGIENIWEFRRQLNCRNIHLILGNHDHHIERNTILPNVISAEPYSNNFITGNPDKYGGLEEGDGEYPNYVEVKRLFSSVQHYKEISFKIDSQVSGRYGKTKIILCHYAMRVWNNSHHGSIMLYGHSHGSLDAFTPETSNPTWIGDQYFIKNYRTMDVGVDTNNLYPYHLDEIVEKMRYKEVLLEVDHHSELTN